MKLFKKFTFIFLCCLTMACNAGNILARMFLTQEQLNERLMDAVMDGDLPAVKRALADGADIHAIDDYALLFAAERGHLPIVQYLLELPEEKRANIHARNDLALRGAAWYGHLAIAQFLVEHGADIHTEEDLAFRWAAENGHLPVVKFLVEHGANVHAENDEALQSAAKNGHWIVVACLLQHGADRTKLDHWQQQELQQALRTSAQVHDYILAELRAALSKNDWSMVERVLDIVPVQDLPAAIQEQIEHLIAQAALGYIRQRELGPTRKHS